MDTCIVFGGTGFIGSFFAEQLLRDNVVKKVILADLEPIDHKRFNRILSKYLEAGTLEYVFCDVRQSISEQLIYDSHIDIIANFAAIHREPGHEFHEYYETNIPGAENVCRWATEVNCHNIIFTSSIAPYGSSENIKNENSIPVPLTAYGCSKLVAEKIHLNWKAESDHHNITIVRPGVVFGPGEGGNVTRLIKALVKRYFFYMGNQKVRKSGCYIRELTRAMIWVHENGRINTNGNSLFNMTMSPAPSVEDYVDEIRLVADSNKRVISIPFGLLFPLSFLVDAVAKVLNIQQPISPVRLKKLLNSNNIEAKYLIDHGYKYKYTLKSALKEWKNIAPEEWS